MNARNPLTVFKVVVLASWLLVSCSSHETIFYDIPEGNAVQTLGEFASQSSNEIIFNSEEMSMITTNRIYGEYTIDDALKRLLSGTSLVYTKDKSGAIAVWDSRVKKHK